MNVGVALAIHNISLAGQYPKDKILPFVRSFSKNVDGLLYVVTDRKEWYSEYKNIVPLDILEIVNSFNIKTQNLTVFNLKPVVFYLLLNKLKKQHDIENVLLTDIDIVYQLDPFQIIKELKIDTFLIGEEKNYFNECNTNSTWFKAGYEEQFDDVKDKKILNCGFTVGKYGPILDYQKQVAKELEYILANRPYFAYDQVILNLLTYSRKTVKPLILPHGNEFVVHMHQMESKGLSTNDFKNGLIYSPNGQPFRTVHQFNEHKSACEFILKTWSE